MRLMRLCRNTCVMMLASAILVTILLAVVFETSGAVNEEGKNVLKQIIRFASRRECVGNSVYAGRAWARLGCCIQFGVAQSILIRDAAVGD